MHPHQTLILIKGAGDLASGVAARLHRCGFPVVMTELPQPAMVRRAVCFGEAIYEGAVRVEEIVGRRAAHPADARAALGERIIPILVDPETCCLTELSPVVLVDAVMAKRNTGTTLADARLVIGLGPGFTAGVDCHAVVETQRGHWLGRVHWQGAALPDTGVPSEIGGHSEGRVLRAPVAGTAETCAEIGDTVTPGQVLVRVAGREVRGQIAGILRGVIRPGSQVAVRQKIGDIDPRAARTHCFAISDKSLAVAGAVLEAILCALS